MLQALGTVSAVLPFEDMDYILTAVLDPQKIYLQTEGKGKGCYIMTTPYKNGKVLKVLVHINYKEKKRVFNYIKSWGVVEEIRMNDSMYTKIK